MTDNCYGVGIFGKVDKDKKEIYDFVCHVIENVFSDALPSFRQAEKKAEIFRYGYLSNSIKRSEDGMVTGMLCELKLGNYNYHDIISIELDRERGGHYSCNHWHVYFSGPEGDDKEVEVTPGVEMTVSAEILENTFEILNKNLSELKFRSFSRETSDLRNAEAKVSVVQEVSYEREEYIPDRDDR